MLVEIDHPKWVANAFNNFLANVSTSHERSLEFLENNKVIESEQISVKPLILDGKLDYYGTRGVSKDCFAKVWSSISENLKTSISDFKESVKSDLVKAD